MGLNLCERCAADCRHERNPNENVCYDTAYMANVSELEVMYPQTITYWDHIGGDT